MLVPEDPNKPKSGPISPPGIPNLPTRRVNSSPPGTGNLPPNISRPINPPGSSNLPPRGVGPLTPTGPPNLLPRPSVGRPISPPGVPNLPRGLVDSSGSGNGNLPPGGPAPNWQNPRLVN